MYPKLIALVAALAFIPSFATADEGSIAEIASETESLSTLVELVVAADLAETLSGEGTFTVFAPTNEAFAALPESIVNTVVSNPDILTSILLYHVLGEEKFATDVLGDRIHTTLQGERLIATTRGDSAFINRSQIVLTDIDADNGVVHVIDRVMIPREARIAILKARIAEWRASLGH